LTVEVWAKDGLIDQVGVYCGYRSVLPPGIRVGASFRQSARMKPRNPEPNTTTIGNVFIWK